MISARRTIRILVGLLAIALLMAGCNLPGSSPETVAATASDTPGSPSPTNTPSPQPTNTNPPPTPTIAHQDIPGEAPSQELFMLDVRAGDTADQQGVRLGDRYDSNRFERPFAAEDMSYQNHLDITRAEISSDPQWLFFRIKLAGSPPQEAETGTTYAVEIDHDRDGGGDWLITAQAPLAPDWSVQGVRFFADQNDNVGGPQPLSPDTSSEAGDGYETKIFDAGLGQDPDLAWARALGGEEPAVEIAIKRSALPADSGFLWGVWAFGQSQDPATFDQHDRMSLEQAGSPVLESEYYPVKSLANVDNTCRMYFGFTPTASDPGLCALYATVQNCTPHVMLGEPGGVTLDGQETAGGTATKQVQALQSYQFYDQNVLDDNDQHPLVLSTTLSPGEHVQITTDGMGSTYACK